jgi:hypothetical protein
MAIKKRIINATANVMSAYPQAKSYLSQRQSNKDFKVLKTANSYKGAPDWNPNGTPTNAYMARSLANDVKVRLAGKRK